MVGALIKEGVSDWQIFQQKEGYASVSISGSWEYEYEEITAPIVYICVKKEDTGEMVIWWRPCDMDGQGWHITLDIPTGGLYQIATCLVIEGKAWSEWAVRGDIVSHVGVGDLYVIAGQSNSSGYGKDSIYDPIEMGVHILKNNQKWELAVHPLQDATGCEVNPVNMDIANTGHSLYLSFARYLKRELGYPIGLIQTSMGGSALETWKPGNGELYINMIKQINLAGGKIKGIVWYQGCSDAVKGLCETYYERFLEMRQGICNDLMLERVPILVCQLNKCYVKNTEETDYLWGTVREQQRRIGHLQDVYTVPTTDSIVSDAYGHITAKSNLVLGERLAKTALTHFYGKHFLCDAPDIVKAERNSDREVLAEFAPVYDKLDTFSCEPGKMAFAAQDEDGLVTLQDYETVGKNQILLKFSRPLGRDCVLHGAYEKDIQKVVPVDFATHLPILSFYGVKVADKEE